MVRDSGGGEIVGAVYSLLMEVHMNMGHPAIVVWQSLTCFSLGSPGPIPVQVKVVVVGSPTGPWLCVFTGFFMNIWRLPPCLPVKMNIAVPPIRVEAWINNDDGVFEPCRDRTVCVASQCMNDFQSSFGAHGFIPVNVITEPDQYGDIPIRGSLQESGVLEVCCTNFFKICKIVRRRDDHVLQQAAFVRVTIFNMDHIF